MHRSQGWHPQRCASLRPAILWHDTAGACMPAHGICMEHTGCTPHTTSASGAKNLCYLTLLFHPACGVPLRPSRQCKPREGERERARAKQRQRVKDMTQEVSPSRQKQGTQAPHQTHTHTTCQNRNEIERRHTREEMRETNGEKERERENGLGGNSSPCCADKVSKSSQISN